MLAAGRYFITNCYEEPFIQRSMPLPNSTMSASTVPPAVVAWSRWSDLNERALNGRGWTNSYSMMALPKVRFLRTGSMLLFGG